MVILWDLEREASYFFPVFGGTRNFEIKDGWLHKIALYKAYFISFNFILSISFLLWEGVVHSLIWWFPCLVAPALQYHSPPVAVHRWYTFLHQQEMTSWTGSMPAS